jgi:opacity protein-like surface antigen
MKRVALVLSLALAVPAVASAQVGFGAAAGASFPMGDYGKLYDSGYHAQAQVDVGIPLSPIGFRFDGTLDHFDAKSSAAAFKSSRIIGGSANVLMGFGAVPLVGPYLIAGVGAYNVNTEPTVGSSVSSTKLGGSVGAGIRFGLSGFGVFAETGYHYIQSPGTSGTAPSYVPVMFGISF